MMTPYDWNESVRNRMEFVEERLRSGSPVIGIRYSGGLLLVTLRGTQSKTFEIYDRIAMSAIGAPSDVEAVRIAALDFAHQEGFARSPDDVTVNRLVSFAISPALKKAFGDAWSAPLVFRGVFAEAGSAPEHDRFATLNFDGNFAYSSSFAVAAGTTPAEEAMRDVLTALTPDVPLQEALRATLEAWALGRKLALSGVDPDSEEEETSTNPAVSPWGEMEDDRAQLTTEAAVLERNTLGEVGFRFLTEDEIALSLPH